MNQFDNKTATKNSIHVIKPCKWNGMWVFDNERVGLVKEPFVAGADTMINTAVELKDIPNSEDGERRTLVIPDLATTHCR